MLAPTLKPQTHCRLTDSQMWWYPWPIPAGHVEFDFSRTATSLQDVKEPMSETPTGAKPGGIPTTLPAGCRGTIHTILRTVLFRSIHSQHPHSPHPYSFQHSKVVTWSFTPRQIVVISGRHFQKQCTQSMLYATMLLVHFFKTHHCGMFTHPHGSSVFGLEK